MWIYLYLCLRQAKRVSIFHLAKYGRVGPLCKKHFLKNMNTLVEYGQPWGTVGDLTRSWLKLLACRIWKSKGDRRHTRSLLILPARRVHASSLGCRMVHIVSMLISGISILRPFVTENSTKRHAHERGLDFVLLRESTMDAGIDNFNSWHTSSKWDGNTLRNGTAGISVA